MPQPRPRLKGSPELDAALAEVHAARAQASANDNTQPWASGKRRFKLQPHQLRTYDAFMEWNAYRQTAEYAEMVVRVGAQYDDVFMNLAGRRVGKTSETILILDEFAHTLALDGFTPNGAVLMYFTAFQKDIGEIIVPLYEELTEDCPRELRATFALSRGAIGMGLFYENGSYVKLVGTDKNPNGLRGRFSDSMAGSEVAFMKDGMHGLGLKYVVKTVLLPQFQRRPWASLILETSQAKDPEHPVLTVFAPDCKLRNAYIERTLDDNTSLDEREYAKIIRQAGGRGDPDCEREFFNAVSRDPNSYVVPEFADEKNIREVARPAQAVGIVIADPGGADMFGLTFGYAHFEQAKYVVERGWARKNASTRQVAAVIAYYEWKLWGRQPAALMRDITVSRQRDRDGWRELLVGTDAVESDCRALRELANLPDEDRQPLEWPLQAPPGCFTHWDRTEQRCKQNPLGRWSDVDLRFVRDLSTEFGLEFSSTAKDDADAQRQSMRNAVDAGRILFDPRAEQVIAHVKNAVWPETGPREGTKWGRHPQYGHFDLLACVMYGWRNAHIDVNPNTPPHLLADRARQYVDPRWARQQEEEQDEVAGFLFSDRPGARTARGGRTSRR